MELKQLTALVAVADMQSVTRAAEFLHLVQPAVTRQIRTLEQELGVALFERNRYGMRPTEAGEAMVEHARRVLHEVERAKAEVNAHAGAVSGLVTVGLLASTAELLTVPLVEAVAEQYPGIRLRLRVGFSGDLQQALSRGDVDTALLYESHDGPNLKIRPLLREKLFAVAAAGSGLSGLPELPLRELASHPLVLPASGQGIRTLLSSASASEAQELVPQIETNSMDVQKKLAAAGKFWTVLPACCLGEDVAAGVIEASPLSEPVVERSIVLATGQDARSRLSVRATTSRIGALVASLVASGRWPSAESQAPTPDLEV